VIEIKLPPLRERREDIPLLINYFITRYNKKHHRTVKGIAPAALRRVLEHDWKGNIRELENAIERSVILSEKNRIELSALPSLVRELNSATTEGGDSDEYSLKKLSRIMEEQMIRKALERTNGNRTHAAKLLEISHPALLSKMKGFGIQ
jgi:two-component system response regulator AtoC